MEKTETTQDQYEAAIAKVDKAREVIQARNALFGDLAKTLALKRLCRLDKALYPVGLIRKRCPQCGGSLTVYSSEGGLATLWDIFKPVGLYQSGGQTDIVAIHYYECAKDGYRFPIKLRYVWRLIDNV